MRDKVYGEINRIINPVVEYIHRVRPEENIIDKPLWVPTGISQGNWYTNVNHAWIANRTKGVYDSALFGDEIKFVDPRPPEIPVGTTTPTFRVKDEVRTLEGWSREDILGPGRVVVDLGSGEAVALLQYSREFPQTIFIGVDFGYQHANKLNMHKQGVQLVKDDWTKLSLLPDNSVDTFLSVQGGLTWSVEKGISEDNDDPKNFLTAVTRAAKEGCIFLADSLYSVDVDSEAQPKYHNSDKEQKVIELFKQHGWERVVLKQSAFFVLTHKV